MEEIDLASPPLVQHTSPQMDISQSPSGMAQDHDHRLVVWWQQIFT